MDDPRADSEVRDSVLVRIQQEAYMLTLESTLATFTSALEVKR
jgi:hypothetical protein